MMLGNGNSSRPSSSSSSASSSSTATGAKSAALIYRQQLKDKQDEVTMLQDRVHSLSAQLEAALMRNNNKNMNDSSNNNHDDNSHSSNGYNNNNNNNHHGLPGFGGGGGKQQQKKKKRRHIPLSPHAMNVREEFNGDRTHHSIISAQRERLGRNASIATRQVLDHLEQHDHNDDHHHTTTQSMSSSSLLGPQQQHNKHAQQPQPQQPFKQQPAPPIQRILDMFQRPSQHLDYLNSQLFAKDLYKVTIRVRNLLETEPRVVYIQSPAYVFGDIHGNLEDLHFFSDNLWRLGLSLTAGIFLFLGDYVDRGKQCLECLAYLFALKIQNPYKLFLLRGNHETRDVNGWEEHYGDRSFIYQCRIRFGDDIGYRIWEICNQAFDRLPLAAMIDQDIFCVHGGIPRPIDHCDHDDDVVVVSTMSTTATTTTSLTDEENQNDNHDNENIRQRRRRHSRLTTTTTTTTRIQDILTVPKVAGINPPYEHEDEKYQQVASDCIWSDPASEEQELTTVDPNTGYGQSLRGGGAICFGHKAVTQFLEQVDCSYIMRAHEAHAEGVAVSKGARVFTVFSTSQDHNQGSHAMAGCILVDNDKLQVINRSPAYKNQYIHRRDSVSLAHVSELEIQKRIRLGLVKDDNNSSSSHVVTTHQHEQYEEETNHAANDQDNDEVDDDDEVLDMEETWQDLDDTSSDAEIGVDLDDEDVVVDDEDDEAHSRPNRRQSRGETSGVILEVGMDGSDCGGGDYVIDKTRRSSVDLTTLNLPPASILEQQQPPESDSQKVARISGSSNNNSSGFVFEQQQPQQQHSIGLEWMRGGTNHGGGGGVLLGSGVLGNGMANNNANNNNNNNRNSNHRTSFFFSSGQQHLQSLLPPQQPQRQSSLSSAFGPIDENNAQGGEGGDNDGGGIVGNDGSIINDDNDQQQQQQIGILPTTTTTTGAGNGAGSTVTAGIGMEVYPQSQQQDDGDDVME